MSLNPCTRRVHQSVLATVSFALFAIACGTTPVDGVQDTSIDVSTGDTTDATDAISAEDTSIDVMLTDTAEDSRSDASDTRVEDTRVEDTDPDTSDACPDPDAPHVSYVARSADQCAVVDFGCPDGWTGFDDARCGCGCMLTDIACDPSKFLGTSGLAEPLGLGAYCDFLVTCSTFPLEEGLGRLVRAEFPDASCADGRAIGCPEGTVSSCEAFIGQVDGDEIIAACTFSSSVLVSGLLCGGDI